MTSTPKKESLVSKLKRFLFSVIRFIVGFTRKYMSFRVWVLGLILLIIVIMGELFTKNTLLILLIILEYILLIYLDKWLQKHEE
jgi:hypothetical protein